MAIRGARTRGLAATLALSAMVISGCSMAEDAGSEAGAESTGSMPATTAGPAADPTPTVSSPPPEAAPASEAELATPTQTESPPVPGSQTKPVPTDTAPKSGSGTASAGNPATVVDVRVGRHDTFDRVVIDFAAGGLPEYEVSWIPAGERLREPGSGLPVEIEANRVLEVSLTHATNRDPETVFADLPAVREVRSFASLESVTSMGIGVSTTHGTAKEVGFRVSAIEQGPPRLVIDVAHANAYFQQAEGS